MSYLVATPEIMTAAATDLAGIGSNVSAAHMAAAAPTLAVIPAAADEVSAGIAQLFSQFGQDYHALADQAAAFEEQFVQTLTASAGTYVDFEAFIAPWLQYLATTEAGVVRTVVADPTQLLNPSTYETALTPVLDLALLPLALPAGVLLLLIFLYLVENGLWY
jgi:hypothetical protein